MYNEIFDEVQRNRAEHANNYDTIFLKHCQNEQDGHQDKNNLTAKNTTDLVSAKNCL